MKYLFIDSKFIKLIRRQLILNRLPASKRWIFNSFLCGSQICYFWILVKRFIFEKLILVKKIIFITEGGWISTIFFSIFRFYFFADRLFLTALHKEIFTILLILWEENNSFIWIVFYFGIGRKIKARTGNFFTLIWKKSDSIAFLTKKSGWRSYEMKWRRLVWGLRLACNSIRLFLWLGPFAWFLCAVTFGEEVWIYYIHILYFMT